jgi:hypothetical protein
MCCSCPPLRLVTSQLMPPEQCHRATLCMARRDVAPKKTTLSSFKTERTRTPLFCTVTALDVCHSAFEGVPPDRAPVLPDDTGADFRS